MGLNKSTGNMHEFITHTWNTIKGECPHGCSYCHPEGTMIMMSKVHKNSKQKKSCTVIEIGEIYNCYATVI
jgi:molybdenum cofactor biosynthesis enzyme MoaA